MIFFSSFFQFCDKITLASGIESEQKKIFYFYTGQEKGHKAHVEWGKVMINNVQGKFIESIYLGS